MGASSLLLLHIFRRLDQWEAAAREAQARQAALQERERIAADLHDYVSQSLFYLNVQLETAAGRLAAQDTAGARRQLQEIRAEVGRLYERRSEEHTSELQSRENLVCRLPLERKKAE